MRAEIWTKPHCPYCVRAKALMEQRGVEYDEYIIGSNATREQLLERAPAARTVPQIWLDGQHVGGYDKLAALWKD